MKRNQSINLSSSNIEIHKKRIAYHESGHAVAILMSNKLKQLPPVPFQITFKNISQNASNESSHGYTAYEDYSAIVNGGRHIKTIPKSADCLSCHIGLYIEHNSEKNIKDFFTAFETDVINLLIGPIVEAKHVAMSDGEVFNQNLINLDALHNYGGSSDLASINQYLACFSKCKDQQNQLISKLLTQSFDFINNTSNWKKIIQLADYIYEEDIKTIDSKQVNLLLNR